MGELGELFNINAIHNLALSYSRLSDFDRNGPKALYKRTFVSNDGATIGSLVDDLLLDKEKFKSRYYIYDGSKPTATLGKLATIILENYKEIPDQSTILTIIKVNKFWKSWTEEVTIRAFDIPEFWEYLKAKYATFTKLLITTEELDLAKSMVHILDTHPNSKNTFNNTLTNYNQFKFSFTYKGFLLRGIIDKVIINHKTKTVRLIDLKTGQGNIQEFLSSFIKWRYYLQEAIYTLAFPEICKELKLDGYSLLPFQFLYISRFQKIPFLFTVSTKWHKAAMNGFTTAAGFEYKGLNSLLESVDWHLKNKEFSMPREFAEADGEILLKDNFITTN